MISTPIRNKQPFEIERLRLDPSESNFLPRLIACLILAEGYSAFYTQTRYAGSVLNQELGMRYTVGDCEFTAKATEIAEKYLTHQGKRVPSFGPVDGARIWKGGPHGHLDINTIPYWKEVEKYFKSGRATFELKRMATEACS